MAIFNLSRARFLKFAVFTIVFIFLLSVVLYRVFYIRTLYKQESVSSQNPLPASTEFPLLANSGLLNYYTFLCNIDKVVMTQQKVADLDAKAFIICSYTALGNKQEIALPVSYFFSETQDTYIAGYNNGMAEEQVVSEIDIKRFLKSSDIDIGKSVTVVFSDRNSNDTNSPGLFEINYFGKSIQEVYKEDSLNQFISSGDPKDLPSIGEIESTSILLPVSVK